MPDAILINGRGNLKNVLDARGNVYQTPVSVFSVQPGKRYRFRLVNVAFECPIEFSIDGHNLTVIASDGNLVDAKEVESIMIMAGDPKLFVFHTDKHVYWECKVLKICQFLEEALQIIVEYFSLTTTQHVLHKNAFYIMYIQ